MTKDQREQTEIVRDLGFKVCFNKESKYHYEDSLSCCAITTFARIMDETFDDTYIELASFGLKNHRNMTSIANIEAYIDEYISKKYKVHLCNKHYNEGAAQYLVRNGYIKEKVVFIIEIQDHIFPIINGTIYDFKNNNIDNQMCTACKIYKLEKK